MNTRNRKKVVVKRLGVRGVRLERKLRSQVKTRLYKALYPRQRYTTK